MSGSAITAFVLGLLSVLTSPLFGLCGLVPAMAALIGAYALRVTHVERLRGRALAMWGFWLGVVFFLISVFLLMLGVVGMKLEG
ncbi:hypothetical protein [Nocardiopsis composta]|uniref:Apolipoprotein N-acyltransferase n=1 Tax=Nocardiopsis composta TaxID=157465 RepID=A0A7W8VCA9_9ACTN|nr:hypothetical protein [Nocardiopsis composta]MBB5430780.1 apolipoprotein N-acyltransferase [Nocardiopsis composta]